MVRTKRQEVEKSEIEAVAAEMQRLASAMADAIKKMNESGRKTLVIHGITTTRQLLPRIEKFVSGVLGEASMPSAAILKDVEKAKLFVDDVKNKGLNQKSPSKPLEHLNDD